MGKGLSKRLTQVGLPLGLGVVGSLSLIVWSQKPVVQPVAAAVPVASTTVDQTASTFDPYHPTAPVVDSTPAVAPAAPVMVSYQTSAPQATGPMNLTNGGNYAVAATVSTGSAELPMTLNTGSSNVVGNTVVPAAFRASEFGASTSGDTFTTAQNAFVTAQTATITVGSADIFVLSSANIHFVK